MGRKKKFPAPAIVGMKPVVSRALRVGKFRADGRAKLKRYMRERNKRAVDQGQSRFVNLDGGYGDET